MSNFREAPFHRACWLAWPHRARFAERVNATDSGYRFAEDGGWQFVGNQKPAEPPGPPDGGGSRPASDGPVVGT
jgi:hypothetical protein